MNRLSDRFERGSRERRLVRQYERNMSGVEMTRVALLDIDTRHDMLLLCDRDEGYFIWVMMTDPDSYEDEFFDYSSYEAARKAFDEWSDRPLEPKRSMTNCTAQSTERIRELSLCVNSGESEHENRRLQQPHEAEVGNDYWIVPD